MAAMLKRFRYDGKDGLKGGEVEFTIIGTICVFTGITFGSDIRKPSDATEEIILTVLKERGLTPRDMQFFELQTRSAYGHVVPGTYAYDRFEVYTNLTGISVVRDSVKCPSAVEEIFRHRINDLTVPVAANQ